MNKVSQVLKKKKIAYVTGTRADFGLMKNVLQKIRNSKKLELKIYATGMHLMSEFGGTVDEVKKYFPDVEIVEARFETGPDAVVKFGGIFFQKLVEQFSKDKPGFVLVLGDRIEMLMVATVCLYLGIPTGHIHGGDRTFTVDEVARHAITKMASMHFPATKKAAERIKKMGEDVARIHVVGAPGLDEICEFVEIVSPSAGGLAMTNREKFILLTLHPESETWQKSGEGMRAVINAIKKFSLPVVAIYPNADLGGAEMIKVLQKEKNNPNFKIYKSLAREEFLKLMATASVWIGNSSAGMIESSSFKVPVIIVGSRQVGREHGNNVINVGYNKNEILKAINKSLYDKKYLSRLKKIKNPWGDGKTAVRIVKILENLKVDGELIKKQITY